MARKPNFLQLYNQLALPFPVDPAVAALAAQSDHCPFCLAHWMHRKPVSDRTGFDYRCPNGHVYFKRATPDQLESLTQSTDQASG